MYKDTIPESARGAEQEKRSGAQNRKSIAWRNIENNIWLKWGCLQRRTTYVQVMKKEMDEWVDNQIAQ